MALFMVHKYHILVLILLCFSTGAKAQTCNLTLKGTVRDEDNSENLGFAVVKLLSPETLQQTNDKGEFVFTNLCPGKYQLLIRHLGCRDTVVAVELNKSRKIQVKLPHSLNALQDVEIFSRHQDVKPVQTVNTLDMKALDKSKGQSLGEQLKQLNGVTTMNTGPTISKPMINGMQGYRILVLNNGIRQEGQQWGNEHAPEIDPFIAQKLSVLRGASAVRYGSDALGGVVLVELGDMPDTASVTGEFNMVGVTNGKGGAASLQLQGYVDKLKYFSWRVQGTYKKTGNLKTPTYYLKNTGMEERNFSYALEYHRKKFGLSFYYSQFNSKVGIFSGAHVGNLTDLAAAFNRSKPQDSLAGFTYNIDRAFQNIEHELVKVNTDFHTGPRSRIYLNYAWQYNIRQEYDKHLPRNNYLASLNRPEADYRIGTHTGEIVWEHEYIRSFRGKFGFQGMHQNNIYKQRFFIPNYLNTTFGVFGMERFIRPKYELEAGARYDFKHLTSYYYIGQELQSPDLRFNNVSYNLGGIYKPNQFLRINLNLANGWRAPAPNELYSNGLHHGVGAIERGDKDLKTETCINVISSAVLELKNLHTEFTAYNYWFKNYIYYLPGMQPELTIRGAFPVFNYTQNDANIGGGDMLLRYKLNKYLRVNARGMWVRGTNKDLHQPLIYMPSDRYELSLVVQAKDGKRFKDSYIEPTWLFVGKQTRVPEDVDFAPPPAAYQLLGLNAGTTLIVKRQAFIFTFSISNAANAVYRDYLDRFRYYNDAAGVNYTLRLRIPFTLYDK